MEAIGKLLDPWCRVLRSVLEAVPVRDDPLAIDAWELHVKLPRPCKYTPQQWGRRSRTASSEEKKLERIREGLDLLVLVRAMGEDAWMWVLVNRCGVGGFDVPMWTDDARILPVLRLQPYHVDGFADVIDDIDQCRHLLVTLQDASKRSDEYQTVKKKLLVVIKAPGPVSYRVRVHNWMSPNTRLSAPESTQVWGTLVSMAREIHLQTTDGKTPVWTLESLDLHLLRSVLTFDAAVALLDLERLNVRINELRIDLLDRVDDELTPSGFATFLTKLFRGSHPPRRLHVDCENASVARLEQLTRVLQSTTVSIAITMERFGLTAPSSKSDRAALFQLLGVCLRQRCIQSLTLDVPDVSTTDITTMAAGYTSAERSETLSSLVLTTDCDRKRWPVIEKLLHLVGKNLEALEIGINGDVLSEKTPKAILSLCPKLEHLRLDRLQLGKYNPLIAHLRQPTSRLRSLSLPRLGAPLEVINELSRTIADRKYPCSLTTLHLDLSDIPNVCDEVVSGLSSALRENKHVRAVTLVLDGDAAAALSDPVHDAFYCLHNVQLVQPLQRHQKLALFSAVASPKQASTRLSQLPLALICEFAGAQSRRRVSIREPGMPW